MARFEEMAGPFAYDFPAALALYGPCGVLWLYRGSSLEPSNDIAGRVAAAGDR